MIVELYHCQCCCYLALVQAYDSCSNDAEKNDNVADGKFILNTTVELCESSGVQMLVYLVLSKRFLSSSAYDATLDSLPWHDGEWLQLLLARTDQAERGSVENFLRNFLRHLFLSMEVRAIARVQKADSGISLKLQCRQTKAMVHNWIFLEVEQELKLIRKCLLEKEEGRCKLGERVSSFGPFFPLQYIVHIHSHPGMRWTTLGSQINLSACLTYKD